MNTREEREPAKPFLEPAQVKAAIRAMQKAAEDAGARWALVGGVALQHLGSPRMTTDVDAVSDQPLLGPPEHRLAFGGFAYRLPTHLGPVPVDWILREDGFRTLYEAALDHARQDADGVPRITPEYLAAMKLAARRGKDLDDLLWLLKSGKVDVAAARELVGRYLGGQFAEEEFDSHVLEAEWRAREENPRDY